ncbi:hypothetical protein [Parasitella parasitica]|uniref:Uncharacterized protein n=1 Tax=Parasitella parasitica TaxID=35722 RepID=A0A0B7N6M0_9FUNG|nr:hypothetical protein [Parasitella parasitica]
MSPSIITPEEVPIDSDFDLQKWLKEIEGAENLMSQVEEKVDTLHAKVDALLLEVGQPAAAVENQDTTANEDKDKPQEKEP